MGMRLRPFKLREKEKIRSSKKENHSKKCSKCGRIKKYDDFYRRKASPDGRQTIYKECMKKYRKEK
jgi:hypothetical protein